MSQRLRSSRTGGAVLLEVLLALMIFAMTAGLFSGAFGRTARTLAELDRQARAADLMVTVVSELQLGLIELTDAGPEPFEPPLDNWTWQVTLESLDGVDPTLPLHAVAVTITDTDSGYRLQQTCRLNRPAEPMGETFGRPYEDDSASIENELN